MAKLGPKCGLLTLITLLFSLPFAHAEKPKNPEIDSREDLIRKYGDAKAIKALENTPTPVPAPKEAAAQKPGGHEFSNPFVNDGPGATGVSGVKESLEQKVKAMLMGAKGETKSDNPQQDAMMDNMVKSMLEKYKNEPGFGDEDFSPTKPVGPKPAVEVSRPGMMIAPGHSKSEPKEEKAAPVVSKAASLLDKIMADMKMAGNSLEKIKTSGPTEKLIRMGLMSYQMGGKSNPDDPEATKKVQVELLERTEGRPVQKWFVKYPFLLRVMSKSVLHPDALANFGKIVDKREKLILFGLINLALFILGFFIRKIYLRQMPLWQSIRVGLMLTFGFLLVRFGLFWAFYHQEVGPFASIIRQSI